MGHTMPFRSPAENRLPPQPPHGALLDALQKHVLECVAPALDSALADVDDYLFDRSQSGEEALGMIALRELRRVRGHMTQQFRLSVLTRFKALREHRAESAGAVDDAGLSLLSDQALEQQLAVEQLAAAVLRSHADAFEVVSKRLCVVTGQAELLPRENPLSPAFLAASLGKAMDHQEMEDELRIVVFKYFERALAETIGELYERCNTTLATAGILPDLRSVSSKPRQSHATRSAAAHQSQPDDPQGTSQQTVVPQGAVQAQISAADQALFASMLGQLQGWRNMVGVAPQVPGMGVPAGPVLGTQDLLSVLSLLQRDTLALQPKTGDDQGTLAGQLREHLAQGARKLGVAGDNMSLDGLDGDAVDLVALLFDVLLDGPQFDSQIRQKIGRMLVPFVKVAVKDRRMFLFKEHPARRLLNTVAEACEGNRGEAPQERELLYHVDHTIDRLVAEFNEDVAIFETLEQELRAYMAQHRRRFELAEKRATESQRGRERLEHARAAVAADINWHRGERELPAAIDEFLSKHVNHHLVQISLRDGQGTPRYDSTLTTVDALMAAFDRASVGIRPEDSIPLPEDELLSILASAGCTDEAAHAAFAAMCSAIGRIAGGESAKECDVPLPELAKLPDPAPLPPEPQPQLEVVAGSDRLEFDGGTLERMRKLKVGDWLQLASSDGVFAPAKVSWISPISSRLLLVNKRGVRVLVASVEEMAAMALLGKLSLREGDNAFDDAMMQMADRLQKASRSA